MHLLLNIGHDSSLLRFRWTLAERMVREGHKVSVAIWGGDGTADSPATELGLAVHRFGGSHVAAGPGDVAAIGAFRNLVREAKPDVMFSCNGKAILFGNLALPKDGPPSAVLIEGLGEAFGANRGTLSRARTFAARQALAAALRRAQQLFVLNEDDEALIRSLVSVGGERGLTRLKGIGIDLARFEATPVPETVPVKALMIARLIEEKGPRIYAEAGRLLKADSSDPPVELHLLGEAVEGGNAVGRAEAEAWAAAGDLVYHLPRPDVRPLIEAAHMVVLPSHYREGLPATLMEAAAMGRPVITTDNPGCREALISGETGLLVPPKDPAALAASIRQLAGDSARRQRMGTTGRQFAEAHFDRQKADQVFLDRLVALAG